jgi:glycosyltransferase involved in cell wall biosynthesis
VSIIITAHDEGDIVEQSIFSALENKKRAELEHSCRVELILVADVASSATLKSIMKFKKQLTVLETNFGDVGLARNLGLTNTHSKYVSFLDGDDLFCFSWISKCLRLMSNEPENQERMVLHPEISLYFGPHSKQTIGSILHESSNSETFRPLKLLTSNLWTSLSFGQKSVYEKFPFKSNQEFVFFGYEDWNFNMEILKAGIEHRVVPETVHFLRRDKPDGMQSNWKRQQKQPRPSDFWVNFLD